VVRLAVGTRPDCMPDEVLDLLASYLDRVDVQLEIGVQSFRDDVLDWYDRGHSVATAKDAILRALSVSQKNQRAGFFDVSAHLIFGAPQETERDLINTAHTLNELGVHGVKVHHLHVLRRTKLEKKFRNGEFPLPELAEYLERIALFLRHLHPRIAVHRVHGTAPHPEELVGPAWSMWRAHPVEKLKVLMLARGWRQGDLL